MPEGKKKGWYIRKRYIRTRMFGWGEYIKIKKDDNLKNNVLYLPPKRYFIIKLMKIITFVVNICIKVLKMCGYDKTYFWGWREKKSCITEKYNCTSRLSLSMQAKIGAPRIGPVHKISFNKRGSFTEFLLIKQVLSQNFL